MTSETTGRPRRLPPPVPGSVGAAAVASGYATANGMTSGYPRDGGEAGNGYDAPRTAGRPGSPYRVATLPADDDDGEGPRFTMRRLAHLGTLVVAPVLLLAFIAAAIVYVRLLHGPVSLKAFAAEIERGIDAELGSLRVKVDDAVIALADGRGLELQLINLRITEPDGDLVTSAPLAAVELDHGALFRLALEPERVFLIEPRVSLRYTTAAGLALSISDPDTPAPDVIIAPAPVPAARPAPADGTSVIVKREPAPGAPGAAKYQIDLARTLADAAARARRGSDASSSLREIGVRDATVSVDYEGTHSEWQVAEAAIDLEHMKRRSVVSGALRVVSERGPWTLSFRVEESDKRDQMTVKAAIADLVPSMLAPAAPALGALAAIEMPLGGELEVDMSMAGEVHRGKLDLGISSGRVTLPGQETSAMNFDEGRLHVDYDAASGRYTLTPSTIRLGETRFTVEGAMGREASTGVDGRWTFEVRSTEGVLAAEEFQVKGVPLEAFTVTGVVDQIARRVDLGEIKIKAGGAEFAARGRYDYGTDATGAAIDATFSPMSLETLKALWPRAAVPVARTWVGQNLTAGALRSGGLRIVSGTHAGLPVGAQDAERPRVSMTLEAEGIEMVPLPDALPVKAPRALVRLEGDALEVTIPDAAIVAAPDKQLPLKHGRFTVVDVRSASPVGELAFRLQTQLATVLDVASRSKLGFAPVGAVGAAGIDGTVDGAMKIAMPLGAHGADQVKAEGKGRITDLRAKQKFGSLELQGGSIDVDITHTGAIASGELLVNGVTAKLELQRIFDADPDVQPPARITATLDNSYRTQLGLDVNHLVQGEVPVEITVAHAAPDKTVIHARADLTNAELTFHDIAWRKAAGRSAFMEFDVGQNGKDRVTLENFKVAGDDIAVEGTLQLDETNEVVEFILPNVSLNVVSRLDVKGKLSSSKIWNIRATGTTYDARDLLRSVVTLGQSGEDVIKPRRPAAGVDLAAEIDTIIGHNDVSMRTLKLKMSERSQKITALDLQGVLTGGKFATAILKKEEEARFVHADTADAGQALRFIGFYPNMQGGRVSLTVGLEADGDAEKTGRVWIDDFAVLGDPVVEEVYSSAGTTGEPKKRGRVTREEMKFDRLVIVFDVGHGQFVINRGSIRSPAIGASIRGRVDFLSKYVDLGGSYIPLQGINAALCEIPLFGPIFTGVNCEGLFGITYLIQGPMASPQVIINPLAMLTPGIFRGIMEMTAMDPKVRPRAERQRAPVEERVRASSSTATGGEAKREPAVPGEGIDGWSSDKDTRPGSKN